MLYIFESTEKCNLKCAYCYERQTPHVQVSPDRSVQEILEQLQKFDSNCQIIFHGGEPLLLPFEDVSLLLSSGVCNSICTNGVLINDDHISLFKEQKTRVCVSFDGLGVLGAHRQQTDVTYNNIHKLVDAGVSVNLLSVLTNTNAGTTEKLDELWEQLTSFNNTLNLKFNYGIGFDQLTTKEWAKVLFYLLRKSIAYMHETGKYVRPFADYICNIEDVGIKGDCSLTGCMKPNRKILGLYRNGDLKTCGRYRQSPVLGNIFEDDYEQMYTRSLKTDLFIQEAINYQTRFGNEKCMRCLAWDTCRGGCIAERDEQTGVTVHCLSTRLIVSYLINGQMRKEFPDFDSTVFAKNYLKSRACKKKTQ